MMSTRDKLMAGVVAAVLAVGWSGPTAPGQRNDTPSGQPGQPDAARAKLTAHINELLTRHYDLGLEGDASIETLLKAVKRVTANQERNDPGIPMYVNPDGLEYVGATMESHVLLAPSAKTLAEGLGKALKSAKLSYEVRDGFLVIDSRIGLVEARLRRLEEKLDRLIQRGEPGKPAR